MIIQKSTVIGNAHEKHNISIDNKEIEKVSNSHT